jgi:hypothetical protein
MITVTPSRIDFGALAPGKIATQTVKLSEAPADALFSARITGEDASFFNVNRVSSFEWVLEAVDPSEMPPGFKGHPKQRVLELAAQTDGQTPLSVQKGQLVEVEIGASAPISSGKLNLSATLFVQGDSWGDPQAVPLSLLYAHVDIVPAALEVQVTSVGSGSLGFSLNEIAGGGTFVEFDLANWPTDAQMIILSDKAFSVGPSGQPPKPIALTFGNNGSRGSGYFHLAATAFAGKQRELFVIKLA